MKLTEQQRSRLKRLLLISNKYLAEYLPLAKENDRLEIEEALGIVPVLLLLFTEQYNSRKFKQLSIFKDAYEGKDEDPQAGTEGDCDP